MGTFKKLLIYMLVGADLGAVAASFIAPGLISWYNDPGMAVTVNVNAATFAKKVTASLLEAQLVGAIIGAVVLLVLGIFLSRSGTRKLATTVTPPTTPLTPPA